MTVVTEVDELLGAAALRIAGADQVALACHVNPDGDALGSMLGLLHVLRAAGANVVASFPQPFVIAPHYRELPGLELLSHPDEFPREPDVMVTFDCGSLGRLGELEPSAKAAHELVRRLVFELGLPLCNDAAVALYAALVCDTGRFQYDTTTPSVFELARELVTFDIPVSRLSRQLFEEHRFAYLKLLGEALAGAELDADRRFVWTAVTQDMLRRHDVTLEEVEGLIDILRRTTEAEVTCVLKEEADGSVRVSLRSLGDVDVRAVAADNGGGGHRFAAGFESTLDIAAGVANIRGAL
jgi:phosphoesterase RecJ-like protein